MIEVEDGDSVLMRSFGASLIIPYIRDSGVGRRALRSKENIYSWEKNITPSQINFDKPIVLCLGGAGIDDDKQANGIAKVVQGMLCRKDVSDTEIQLLSVVYPKDAKMLGEERKKFSRGEPRGQIDYICRIYETVFVPVLRKIWNIDSNEKLEEVKRQLRNITIFSHCHGSFVACELINYLKDDIAYFKKYSPLGAKLDDLTGEITNIMLSPREGVQNSDGALNIGFTLASDNLEGGIDTPKRKGANVSISNFCDKLLSNKIKGSENFGFKYGAFYNFWDTDRFGADIKYTEDFDAEEDEMSNMSSSIYDNIFMKNHFHLFENYCSLSGKFAEEGVGEVSKNEKGTNFTKIIARTLQNAVSLSSNNQKREVANLISNETPVNYSMGVREDNAEFFGVKFNGSLETLLQNGSGVFKQPAINPTLLNSIQNQR